MENENTSSAELTDNEKLFLLDCILQDIRGNWGWELEPRVEKALELAEELNLPRFVSRIEQFKKNWHEEGDNDGRYFRIGHECGGYEGMSELHGLTYTISDKSSLFQKEAQAVLTYSEYWFDDWEAFSNTREQ